MTRGMTDIHTSHGIEIPAPRDRVWEALTTPDEISQWFFGVDTHSDWKVGSSIVHRGEYQGRPYEDTGEILELDAPKRLLHTHWCSMSACATRPRIPSASLRPRNRHITGRH